MFQIPVGYILTSTSLPILSLYEEVSNPCGIYFNSVSGLCSDTVWTFQIPVGYILTLI